MNRMIVSLGLWIALAALAVNAVVVAVSFQTITRSNLWVDHTRQVITEVEHLLSVLENAETGQRGYLLTGRDEYLEPYRAAVAELDPSLGRVRSLTSDNPAQQSRIAVLQRTAADKTAELEQTITLRHERSLEAASEFVKSDRGKRLMDRARVVASEMEDEEKRLLNDRTAASQAANRLAVVSFAVTTGAGLLLVLAVSFLVRRAVSASRRAAEAILQERSWLTTTLMSIGDAVIATDRDGQVKFMNPVAEALTGWPQRDAEGWSVGEVFRILNEETRRPAENPVERAIREGVIVGLGNHTLLIARDGTERPIEDSAAPIQVGAGDIIGVVMVFRDATAKRRNEAELRESEARFRTLAENNPHIIARNDRQHRILYINEAAQTVTMRPAASFIGKSARELGMPPEICARWEESQDRAFGGERVTIQTELTDPAGRQRWLLDTFVPEYAPDGSIQTALAISQDVTELVEAQKAQRESEARLRAVFDALVEGIVFLNPQGEVVEVNDAISRLHGQSLDELTDAELDPRGRLVRGDGTPFPVDEQPAMVALRTGEAVRDVEMGVPLRDGSLRWRLVNAQPVRDERGHLLGAVASFFDFTERKRAEEALRRSERLLQDVIDGYPSAIFIKDLQGRFLKINKPLEKLLGISDEEIRGKTDYDILTKDRADFYRTHDRKVEETGQPIQIEEVADLADGQHIYLATEFPLYDPDGQIFGICAISHDITESKRAQDALAAAKLSAEQAQAQAEQAADLAMLAANLTEQASKAKDHFLAVLSHELRTPLTPVLATVIMLQQDPRLDGDIREELEVIRRNAELEALLIDDLLDVTRIQRGKFELNKQSIELCTIIKHAVDVCLPDIGVRKLEFGVDIGPDAPYFVEADPARLQQVIWNLLKNAIKFTPIGGCVGIRCRRDGDGFVVMEVNDSGEGIEPAALGRIFNAFEQAGRTITRQFGGLGLGLTISKAIVEMHGGTIGVHSRGKYQGATFRVRLPLLTEQPDRIAPESKPLAAAAKRPARLLQILLVEDHGDTARIMKRMLMADGHEVEAAADLATALKLAGEHTFDLMLSDLGLPDGSGLDLMRTLRARGSTLVGIALSGFGQQKDIEQSLDAGFAAHLTKPADYDRLVEAIRRLTS